MRAICWRRGFVSGPAFFESLNVFPSTSKFVASVNLGNNSLSIARDQVAAAIKFIGLDRIRAFEREPYSDSIRNLSHPSSLLQWVTKLITTAVDHVHPGGLPQTIRQPFSIGRHSLCRIYLYLPNDSKPEASRTIRLTGKILPPHASLRKAFLTAMQSVFSTSICGPFRQRSCVRAKALSPPRYQYSTCDPARNAIATLPHLVNHTNVTVGASLLVYLPALSINEAFVNEFVPQVQAANKVGKDFVIGILSFTISFTIAYAYSRRIFFYFVFWETKRQRHLWASALVGRQ